jgi:pyruvate dehydrogenase E1 component beta subunit
MAIKGQRPICEMQFSGFAYLGFHQLESHAARMRWRSQGRFHVPMVVRMPYGGGVRALEHHSESREVYYAHTPGLKFVVPSGPRNARALLVSAIRDPDPVIFFEPKAVYRSFREEVPDDEETAPIGKPSLVRQGDDLTVVAWGAMLHRALAACDRLRDEDGVSCDVVDLLTLAPLDERAIHDSVRKTGRVVVVQEAPMSFGPAGELTARLADASFLYLEAPIARVTGYDTPMPFFAREQAYLPSVERIVETARATLAY